MTADPRSPLPPRKMIEPPDGAEIAYERMTLAELKKECAAAPPSLDALKSTEKSGGGVDQEGSTTSTGARASNPIARVDASTEALLAEIIPFFVCCFSLARDGHSPDCLRASELQRANRLAMGDDA